MDVFKNLLLSNPRTYLGDGTGLLESSNNLSDVGDAVTAAGNLGVYTKAESNTRLNALAPRQGVVIPFSTSAQLRDRLDFGLSDFSIGFFFRPTTWTNGALLFRTAASGNSRMELYSLTAGYRFGFVDSGGGSANYDITGAIPTVNAWSHVLFVADRDGLGSVYLNGVLAGTVSIAASSGVDIGAVGSGTTQFYGSTSNAADIANLTVFNFALPATTTSGVVGVAERYADGVWVRPSERGSGIVATGNFVNSTDAATDFSSISGASTTGVTATYDNANANNRLGIPITPYNRQTTLRVRFSAALNGASNVTIRGSASTSFISQGGFSVAVTEGANDLVFQSIPITQVEYIGFFVGTIPASGDLVISDFSVQEYSATLDLQPQGIGRTIIDRSANRNHATVAGTTLPTYLQPTDGGKIVTRTSTSGNVQLMALAAFDAANRYRITSWTVTALTGTPEIDLGNVSAGKQYVADLVLATGVPTAITLLTSIAATANLWINSTSTDVIIHAITYERISD